MVFSLINISTPTSILRTPFFSPSNNFLVNFNVLGFFFSKLRLAFRFSCHRFLSFTSDNFFLTDSRSSGVSLSRFLKSLCSTLSRPFSLCIQLAVRMVFPFWTSAAPKGSNHTACTILVKESIFTPIDPFKLFRRMKDLSSSRGLQSIVICSRLFNANCTLFHTGCGRLTKKVILSIVVILLTLVPFTSIYLSLIEIYVIVD